MIAPLGAKSDTRSVVQPEPPLFRLFHWHFQPLASPKPLNPLVVDLPTSISQHGRDPPITVAAILPGQFNHVSDQAFFIGTTSWQFALRGSVLSQNTTSPPLRHTEFIANTVNARTATGGA